MPMSFHSFYYLESHIFYLESHSLFYQAQESPLYKSWSVITPSPQDIDDDSNPNSHFQLDTSNPTRHGPKLKGPPICNWPKGPTKDTKTPGKDTKNSWKRYQKHLEKIPTPHTHPFPSPAIVALQSTRPSFHLSLSKKLKNTTRRIPVWSPTTVLTSPFEA